MCKVKCETCGKTLRHEEPFGLFSVIDEPCPNGSTCLSKSSAPQGQKPPVRSFIDFPFPHPVNLQPVHSDFLRKEVVYSTQG